MFAPQKWVNFCGKCCHTCWIASGVWRVFLVADTKTYEAQRPEDVSLIFLDVGRVASCFCTPTQFFLVLLIRCGTITSSIFNQTRPSHQNYISFRFPKFPGTGRSKGLAYVEFYLQEATLKALALSGPPSLSRDRRDSRLCYTLVVGEVIGGWLWLWVSFLWVDNLNLRWTG